MLLRPTHLTVTNTFAALRLLPMSDRDKDIEILALRTRSPSSNANSAPTPNSDSLPRTGPFSPLS
ncbi:hypothetical protein [Nonomuraea sp. NPDC052265]|uniref:hypothetical protein n=1 Tax=Nonomuraea sp. NPDC052265 TaxID=3364374 RepID=UPI0037C7FD1D